MGPEASGLGAAGSAALEATRSPGYARWLAGILAAMLATATLALIFVPWQQTAFGSGQVVAYAPLERQQAIDAPLDGRVVRWHVREGSRVKPGDPVVVLTDNDPEVLERLRQEQAAIEARLAAGRERVERLSGRVAELRASRTNAVEAARSRTAMARDRVEAAAQALAAARTRTRTARLNLDRQQALAARGLAPRRAAELAVLEHAQARTEEERAQAGLSAARSEVGALGAEQRRAGTDVSASVNEAEGGLASARAEVASARAELVRMHGRAARQGAQEVRATREGTILRLIAGIGNEIVKAGDPLAVIVPDADVRAVEVWVGGLDAPFVTVGRRARVQVEGWPVVQVVGWPSVAVGMFPARVAVVDAAADAQGRLRAVLVPDPPEEWPEERFLRQGLQARGWVLLGQVSLGFELWRQFNGFPPGVGPVKDDRAGAANPMDLKSGK